MTLTEFKNKYLGKQVEYHSFGTGAFNQCVDLVNAYINECLDNNTTDYTEIIGTNAKDFNTKFDPDDFEWIANTLEGVPLAGDIVVWNGRVGGNSGHVAIALEGNKSMFNSLDQNWSQVERVTLEAHNYTNVSGWLRPKHLAESLDWTNNQCLIINNKAGGDKFTELVGKSAKYEEFVIAGFESADKTKDILEGHKSQATMYQNKFEELEKQVAIEKEKTKQAKDALAVKEAECHTKVDSLQAQIDELSKTNPDLEKVRIEYEGLLRVMRESRDYYKSDLNKANVRIAELQAGHPKTFLEKLLWLFI